MAKIKILTILSLIILITIVPNTLGSLISYYDFETGSGLPEDVADSNNVTDTTNLVYVPGKIGVYAANFTAGFINISDAANLDGYTSMSVSVWVKTPDFSSINPPLLSKGGAGQYQYNLQLQHTGTIAFDVFTNKDGSTGAWARGTTNITDNQWHHVVGAFTNNTNVKIYVDGVLENTTSLGSYVTQGTGIIRSGRRELEASTYTGHMDDLAIFNHELNQTAIDKIYCSGGGQRANNSDVECPISTNFSIVAHNWITNQKIMTFNVTVEGNTYTTTSGSIITSLLQNHTSLVDVYIQAGGHYARNYTSYNISTNLTGELRNTTELLTINILNSTGGFVTTSTYWDNITNVTSSVNPYTTSLWDYINLTQLTRNITINVTDTSRYNKKAYTTKIVNRTNTIINITLDQNQLVLTFSSAVYGVIMDEDKGGYNFTNVTIVYDQIDFSLGVVKAKFNNLTASNFTQYYEYENDGTAVNDTIEIMTASNNYAWFQILDAGNAPLKNAKVRIHQVKPILGIYQLSTWKLVGQRITGDDGIVYFQLDNFAHYKVVVSKDDYVTQTVIIDVADMLHTDESDAEIIILPEGGTVTKNGIQYTIRNKFTNRSAHIYGSIYAPSRTKIEYYTSYLNESGGQRSDAVCDSIDLCDFTLLAGTHFSETGTENITLYIYIDDELHDTKTIAYDGTVYTQIVPKTDIDDLDTNTTKIILGILLITLACASGIIWKEQPKAPLHTFFIGSIIVGILNTSFLYLSFVAILYYVLKTIKKVISE